ncbi:DUF4326 domain-containing protein [Halovenus marina]|uniref:DUF4326 domain-containing protein n=1 Tax=Halovenus marina TaxID=3396621 RepID=UPI003F54E4F0
MSGQSTDDTERTRVGHYKADETDVYVGRGPDGRDMTEAEIGERGWLGNPFSLDDHSREHSIERFRQVFIQRIQDDGDFAAAVADLSGQTLGCWCQRLDEDGPACHAEIIADHADRLAAKYDTGTDRNGGPSSE